MSEPNRNHQRPTHESRSTALIVLLYAAMSLIALGLIAWRADGFDMPPLRLIGPNWRLDLALAGTAILAVHLASRALHQRWQRLRRASRDMANTLGQLSVRQTAIVAMASGVGEELLFRAYLLNETGLWISSILFGLIHVPPNARWRLWPLFAFLMGLLLGAFYLQSRSILPPILIHAGINYLNLRLCLEAENASPPQG